MNPRKPLAFWIPLIVAVLIIVATLLAFGENFISPDKDDTNSNINISNDAKKTIVFSFGGIDFNVNLKTQISLFMQQYPHIEVKILQLPGSTDYQRNSYVSAFKSGDQSVDVIMTDIIWTAEFASNGWVLPLDDYFTQEMRKEFIKGAIDGCTYDGIIYAIPKRSDVPLLYYRKDIIPKAPETIEEMIEMVKKYKSTSGVKYGYVFQGHLYEGLVCNALEFIWAYGGDVIRNGEIVINSPESLKGLQTMVDIVNGGISSPDVLTFVEDDSMLAFQDGNALFMRNWPYAYKQLNVDGSAIKGNVGICPLPMGEGVTQRSTGTLGGWNYMINKNSKHPDEAWLLIEWLTSYDMQVLDSTTGGNPPTRTKVFSHYENQKDPFFCQLLTLMEDVRLRPVSPDYPTLTELMQINFSNALYKKIDAESALKNIEDGLVELINKRFTGAD